MEFLTKPYMMAFWFGILTAVSLPLGAMLGIWLKPSSRVVAAIMAFGAGNLLAALTMELVEPAFLLTGFWPISIGCILGCLTFVGLNQALDNSGGYMRKASTLVSHLKKKRRKHLNELLDKLSRVEILRALPPEEMHHILPSVEDRQFKAGSIFFHQGDPGDSLYLIESGCVRIDAAGAENKISDLCEGQTFGEMALLWHEPRTATATAVTDTLVWEIHREDFNSILDASPALREQVTALAEKRKAGLAAITGMDAAQWKKAAAQNVHEEDMRPSALEITAALEKSHSGGGAAMSMWLGIFLDGIPESLTIGASMIGKAVSPALIGGLFFANLPEAMSSGTMMKRQGLSTGKIFWMWMSLCIMTGIGALLGNLLFVGLPASTHSIFGGLAAGAMLAMIAQTMLPEAYEHGGWLVGILTVLGFIVALMFRAMGHETGHTAQHTLNMLIHTLFAA